MRRAKKPETTTVQRTELRMVAISFHGDADGFAAIVDEAFGLVREASRAHRSIDTTIERAGVHAHVKVDP